MEKLGTERSKDKLEFNETLGILSSAKLGIDNASNLDLKHQLHEEHVGLDESTMLQHDSLCLNYNSGQNSFIHQLQKMENSYANPITSAYLVTSQLEESKNELPRLGKQQLQVNVTSLYKQQYHQDIALENAEKSYNYSSAKKLQRMNS